MTDETDTKIPPETPGREMIGQQIGKYEVRGLLGRGSTGLVYLGYDPQLGRQVAIKVLQVARQGSSDADFRTNQQIAKRFIAEAQSTGRLKHQNIIALFEGNVSGPAPFLVMEYVEGRTLDSYIKSGHRFELDELMGLLRQLADAIDYAHSQGVLHRDIKPANILIDLNNKPYVLDFGVAKIHEQISSEDEGVRPTAVLGTPAYMSPEQIRNKALNNKSDLFAFAIVTFQCLCGQRPFEGDTFTAVAGSILEKPPIKVTSLRKDLTSAVDDVFNKALSKERADRYESAKQFVHALAAAVIDRNRDSSSERSLLVPPERKDFPGKNTGRTTSHIDPPKSKVIISPFMICLILLGLLILTLSTIIYVFWPRRTVVVFPGEEFRGAESIVVQPTSVPELISTPAIATQETVVIPEEVVSPDSQEVPATKAAPVLSPYQALVDRLMAEEVKEDGKNPAVNSLIGQIRERVLAGEPINLIPMLYHRSFTVKIATLKLLIEAKNSESVSDIVPLLEDSDPLVRGFAAKALGVLANKEQSLSLLAHKAQQEPVPEVKRAIENAMERISERE